MFFFQPMSVGAVLMIRRVPRSLSQPSIRTHALIVGVAFAALPDDEAGPGAGKKTFAFAAGDAALARDPAVAKPMLKPTSAKSAQPADVRRETRSFTQSASAVCTSL
jgi:hypothetical protein